MRSRTRAAGSTVLALALALAGCATGDAFAPKAVTSFGRPYEGLDASSYGPRSLAGYRPCDPMDAYGSTPAPVGGTQAAVQGTAFNIATAVGQAIGAPLQGAFKVDATLETLDLARHFRVPADSDHPTVAVPSHGPEQIVFWHSAMIVRLPELGAAAGDWCTRQQRTAAYRGSASRCPPGQKGLGGTNVVNTYAISVWACTPAP
jgi:hypothetical protein